MSKHDDAWENRPRSPAPEPRSGAEDGPCFGSCDGFVSARRMAAGHTLCHACQSLWDRAVAAGRARGIEEGKEAVAALVDMFRQARSRWIEISCGRTLTADELGNSRACDDQLRKWERIADSIAKETR